MKRYFSESKGKGKVHTAGIEYVLNLYAGKTLYATDYNKLIRKLGMFPTVFEQFVEIKCGKVHGIPTVTILREI